MALYSIGNLDEFPEGQGRIVKVESQEIAVFRVNGEFYGIDNHCPHRGGPLAEGEIQGTVVQCPWHLWDFDLRTGECLLNSRIRQRCFQIQVEGDRVFIQLADG